MKVTAFYAWQSDRNAAICRFLIRDAVKLALKRLNADAKLTAAPSFELDHDTKGIAGHPHIATTIRKKIKQCAVFIADVTHVAEYITSDGRAKHAPNANVMIELGIAIRAKGFERLVLVMNEAFGPAAELPFDLKSHSFPVTYSLSSTDAGDRAKVKAVTEALAKTLAAKLKPMFDEIKDADRTGSASAAAEVEERERAEAKWRAFDERFGEQGFHGMAVPKIVWMLDEPIPRGAFFHLSIIPLKTLPVLLDVGQIRGDRESLLQPIGYNSAASDLYGKSFVLRDRRQGTKSATEVNDDGCLFAAAAIKAEVDPNGAEFIVFEIPEFAILTRINGYLCALRQLGVVGPVQVRVKLIGLSGCYLVPSSKLSWDTSAFRKLNAYVACSGPITITGDMDDRAVVAAMQPAFLPVWRDAGLPLDPCFDSRGNLRTS